MPLHNLDTSDYIAGVNYLALSFGVYGTHHCLTAPQVPLKLERLNEDLKKKKKKE